MTRIVFAVWLLAMPAFAQTMAPGPTPGPTSSPTSGNPSTAGLNGTANILQPDQQGAPLPPGAPVPATPPSGAPPDVMVVPK